MTDRAIPIHRVIPIALVITIVAAAPRPGRSQPSRPSAAAADSGSIVFVHGSSLWRVSALDGPRATAVAIATLGDLDNDAAAVTRLEASPNGNAVLIELGDRVGWVPGEPGEDGPGRVHLLDCTGPGRFTPRGTGIACTGRNGRVALHRLPPGNPRPVHYPAGPILGFADRSRVVIGDAEGLWADSINEPGRPTLLAPHRPSGALLVAPDGRRAVGVYPPIRYVDKPGLYIFPFDGKGTRRRLLQGAEPVAWSLDSRWLLARSAREGACIVRASGGQYKCWARYQAIDLGPDGSHVLLGKPSEAGGIDLYVGRLAGARPESPTLVAREITGPAVWLPPRQ